MTGDDADTDTGTGTKGACHRARQPITDKEEENV